MTDAVEPATVPERLRAALADRYHLEEVAGRGGMATVYRARDLKHDRAVAIKVFRPELIASGVEAERFVRETRIAARLSHPLILPLHDSGQRDGFLFYVTPYVGSETLRHRLTGGERLPVEEAVRLAGEVAGALDYAHRQGVVHRDIKPENILLHEGRAVVADFGIARALSAAGGENVTERGLALGTPAYMSPEQASAEAELDGRSDQYALACVLFEMLTGEPPFHGRTAQATLARHLTEPPRPLAELRPTVPEAVERSVARALAKDPADRFPTAAAFAEALRADAPEPDGFIEVVRPTERAIAVLPLVNAGPDPADEYLSDGLSDELINALANVKGLRVASRSSAFALKGRREGAPSLGRELGVSAVLEGSVRRVGQRVRVTAQLTEVEDGRLLWSQRYDRQLDDLFAVEEEIARTIVGTLRATFLADVGDPSPKRYTENRRAWHFYLMGRHAWNRRTAAGIQEAVRHFEAAIAEDPAYALAFAGLSDCHALQVDYRGAPVAEGMRRAREEAERALALDDGLAEAHTSLGWVTFIHDWSWPRARHHFTRAIALNPRYATARQWYSWYLMAMGRPRDAVAEGRTARELDAASSSIARSLGWLLHVAGDQPAAIAALRHAVTMDPASHETLWTLGLAYTASGQLDEAEAALRESQANDQAYFHAFSALAAVAVRRGRRPEAEAMLAELTRTAATRYVSPVDFARMHLALGNHDRVFEWLERAYQERRGWLCYLRVEPKLDPLRGDPRFRTLLLRMNLD